MDKRSDTRLTVSVPEAASRFGVSVTHMWNLVHQGEVRSVKLGSRVLIPVVEIDRILAGAQVTQVAS